MHNGQGDLGVICDGQLAAMFVESAQAKGFHPVVLGTSETSSAAQAVLQGGTFVLSNEHKDMSDNYNNPQKLDEFVAALKSGAPVAFDWENAPKESLDYLQARGLYMKPRSEILYTTQHRGREKSKINEIHGKTVTATYEEVSSFEDAKKVFKSLGAGRLKTCEGGYDGKGQYVINSESDLEEAFADLGDKKPDLVYEKKVDFAKEISVIVGRNELGEFAWYSPFENRHQGGILRQTYVGNLEIDQEVQNAMIDFTKKTAEGLGLEGIMALEMFLLKDGSFLANEIAARAHNSGHITRDSHDISQFDLQIMAMKNEKLDGHIPMKEGCKSGYMNNLIGYEINNIESLDSNTFETKKFVEGGVKISHTSYGKGEPRDGRKMGHENVVFPK